MKRRLLVCLGCAALAFPALAHSAHASNSVQITATHPLEPLSLPTGSRPHMALSGRANRADECPL